MIDEGECGAIGGMKIGRGSLSTWKKTCPSATLSTTNPTRPDLGRCSGKPATNCLSYGTALFTTITYICQKVTCIPAIKFKTTGDVLYILIHVI
jgi:hypothetical protein